MTLPVVTAVTLVEVPYRGGTEYLGIEVTTPAGTLFLPWHPDTLPPTWRGLNKLAKGA